MQSMFMIQLWRLHYDVDNRPDNHCYGSSRLLLMTPLFAVELAIMYPEATTLEFSTRIGFSFWPLSWRFQSGQLLYKRNLRHVFAVRHPYWNGKWSFDA